MKNNPFLYIALVCIFLCAACSEEETEVVTSGDDRVVQLRAAVSGAESNETTATATRGDDITTDNITEFGFFLTTKPYNNVRVYRESTSSSTWTSDTQMFWNSMDDEDDTQIFFAYAPYSADYDSYTVSSKMNYTVPAEQTAANTTDCVAAGADDCVAATDLTVIDGVSYLDIKFEHVFAKLTIKFTFNTELLEDNFYVSDGSAPDWTSDCPVESLIVAGTYLTAAMGLNDSDIFDDIYVPASDDDAVTDITPYLISGTYTAPTATSVGTAQYRCMLIPQEVSAGNFGIEFDIGAVHYSWYVTEKYVLEHNMHYTINVSVGSTVMVTDEITASAWIEGNDITITIND